MGRVAVIQMTSGTRVSDNLIRVNNLVMEASRHKAELVLLPENFALMSLHSDDLFQIAEDKGIGLIQDRISTMAKRYKVWIIAGTLPLKHAEKNKVFASSLVFNSEGEIVARYNKMHLFDVSISNKEIYKESDYIEKGYELVTVDTPVGRVGLSACYDLRFPEFYRELSKRNVDIFSIPSAFTHVTGRAHWEVLVRARAIENLTYVLAANQTGEHENGRTTYGHSMIVSPWGDILAECKNNQSDVIYADINLNKMEETRNKFPCLAHKLL